MKLSTLLDQIDMGGIALPEFQRGYVWNREQVRRLMVSLYQGHPVGSLLVWETQTEQAIDQSRGNGKLSAGTVKLLLDGQQRITSLYGLIRGKAPAFFDGNRDAFTGLYFNFAEETFSFYMPTRMKDNPLWISVTKLMQTGFSYGAIAATTDDQTLIDTYCHRLNSITNIKERDFHIETVTGVDKTVDEVVEIFNKVNSGGTKLSKGDLALARICAAWPEARDQLKSRIERWEKAGFRFKLDWFLRCITAVITNESSFSGLKDVSIERFQKGLIATEKAIDTLLNVISARLGLDHARVLGSVYAFPLMARYLDQRGGHFPNHQERDQLLYWYIHTMLWGRYSGSTESVLRKDLKAIEGRDGSLTKLIELLRQDRGDLHIRAGDFGGSNLNNRFYPLLYLLTRVCKARDWEDDIELSQHLLGSLSSLEIHHIFPKSKLYAADYQRAEVNAIANFTFLTKATNLKVSNHDPAEYFAHYENKHPGTISSHWISTEPELAKYENYADFLTARRNLLAQAANTFLDSLYAGAVPEQTPGPAILDRIASSTPGIVTDDEEYKCLSRCNQWILQHNLPSGELAYALADSETDELLATLDLAWPDGLQQGYSQPVTLLLNEDKEIEAIANRSGFRFFTNVEQFQTYVRREILASEAGEEITSPDRAEPELMLSR
ncbi:DUF262 domain-containing protein [cf. Phormidesmis sp. LEGE 11477]|uniref:GmrSD restriction endonuclease domain-containing protein n=1 Tax=cf. Phormidesmis sp. LEGE 11477 TaxID=1828680 RepID=UPI00187DE809|nr:DUF262 domain-containing protein [cf. Phormidesmis sp. LEGE 11477]MBE9063789.1 DUF262 domain-containing protein [cf. Phormidesmis sp. LEGE 11477]